MSDDTVHDEVESLLGAYALDAVDDDERALVESHLEGCPRCRAEVDAFMEVAAALGNSIDPVPPELWARIGGRLDLSAPGDATLLEIRAKARQQIAGFAPRRVGAGATAVAARWQRRAMVAAAAAAAVALALVSLSLSNANSRVDQLQALAAARGAGAAAQAALADPAHRLVELRGPGGAQLATVVVSPTGTGYLLASHFAPLPGTQTYQLWARIDSRPISLGLLGPRPARDAAFTVGTAASALLVTVEPAGGTVRPSGSPVAVGPVTA
ncbi:MAG TPA: anti-sigma factor [Acidimicrobiales bacterium]|nr:anti-sigma factor [Acidimicrobiales bacterium]